MMIRSLEHVDLLSHFSRLDCDGKLNIGVLGALVVNCVGGRMLKFRKSESEILSRLALKIPLWHNHDPLSGADSSIG